MGIILLLMTRTLSQSRSRKELRKIGLGIDGARSVFSESTDYREYMMQIVGPIFGRGDDLWG